MKLSPLLIVFFVVGVGTLPAEESKKPLTFDDLMRMNNRLIELDEFLDNEFIYNEKLSELLKEVETSKGWPVWLSFRVEKVSTSKVSIRVPTPRAIGRALLLKFKSEGKEEPIGQTQYSYLYLNVGELVEPALAKRLRKGDQVVVSGQLQGISPHRPRFSNIEGVASLEFVVGKATVEMDAAAASD